ncbi:MAG TPA: GGDEF domain-containing protein [Longimicrobiales bacterium]|nr:GGDEF domain-containing protein [Longimicrobiales bacterium]
MDIRTLLVSHLTLLGLYSVSLVVIRATTPGLKGIGWLAGCSLSAMAGVGLIAARGRIPDALSIVAGNALIVVAAVLQHRAVIAFLGRGRPRPAASAALVAAVVGGFAYYTFAVDDPGPRIVILGVAFAAQIGWTAALLLRHAHTSDAATPAFSLGVVLAAFAGLNVVRIALTLTRGAPADFMGDDGVQALSMLGFLVGTACVAFGFLWMTNARLRAELHHQASTDPLTGLLNRRGFFEVAPRVVRAAERESRSLAVIVADVDGLKRINDAHGHEVGDHAICEAADVLSRAMRASDAVARLGGDEFCALVDLAAAGDVDVILRRIQDAVRARNALPGRPYAFDISAGALHLADSREPLEKLLHIVDERMYAEKRARRRHAAGSRSAPLEGGDDAGRETPA